jgi:hypothetical protein
MHKITAWDEAEIEGMQKGTLLTARRYLLKFGQHQFGKPSAKVEAALNAIQDPDHLDRMADAIPSAKSWKELLAVK